jgi:DnaJ-class molecular chaperone
VANKNVSNGYEDQRLLRSAWRQARRRGRRCQKGLSQAGAQVSSRFKELQEAYDVLSDPENRKLYDQYGENWRAVKAGAGAPPPPGWERTQRSTGGPRTEGFDFGEFGSFGGRGGAGFDIFEELFGGAGRGRAARGRGQDVEAELELSLEDVHRGARRTIQMQMPDICPTCNGSGVKDDRPCDTCGGAGQVLRQKNIEVNIPVGVRDGSTVRLAGQGGSGSNGSEPGDLYLHIRVRPHPVFTVKGDDLELELPIAPWEAVLGASVEAPTIDGKVELKIPPGAKSSQRLRLRGQGLNMRKGGRGDEYVRLKIVVPKEASSEERRLYEELKRISRFDPRRQQ